MLFQFKASHCCLCSFLRGKKKVFLNWYFFRNCTWSKREEPHSYQKYSVFLLRKQFSPQALQLPISQPTPKVHIQALLPQSHWCCSPKDMSLPVYLLPLAVSGQELLTL